MKLLLQLVLIFTILVAFQNKSFAQSDSTVTYDVVYLKKGGMLKGEILSFDSETGFMVFKDTKGVKYSLGREEYDRFIENKVFTVKKKGASEIKARKENEFEFSGGFRISLLSFNDNFDADDYYLNSNGGVTDLPLSIHLGVGKYMSRKHFIGASGELAMTSYGKKYFAAGARYAYQYDSYKRNVALYIPVELQFFSCQYDQRYQVADTVIENQGGSIITYYPSDLDVDYTLRAASFSLGQGLSFIMNNKNSIALELSFVKFFPFTPSYIGLDRNPPKMSLTGHGFRFSLIYNI